MSEAIIESKFHFEGQTNVYNGKVRDVYTLDNGLLVMVASDRISAFDHVLPKGIPHKGQVLNQVASMFLDATKDIVPNWLLATPDPSVAVGYAPLAHHRAIVRGDVLEANVYIQPFLEYI